MVSTLVAARLAVEATTTGTHPTPSEDEVPGRAAVLELWDNEARARLLLMPGAPAWPTDPVAAAPPA